jgi:hypothetical protein
MKIDRADSEELEAFVDGIIAEAKQDLSWSLFERLLDIEAPRLAKQRAYVRLVNEASQAIQEWFLFNCNSLGNLFRKCLLLRDSQSLSRFDFKSVAPAICAAVTLIKDNRSVRVRTMFGDETARDGAERLLDCADEHWQRNGLLSLLNLGMDADLQIIRSRWAALSDPATRANWSVTCALAGHSLNLDELVAAENFIGRDAEMVQLAVVLRERWIIGLARLGHSDALNYLESRIVQSIDGHDIPYDLYPAAIVDHGENSKSELLLWINRCRVSPPAPIPPTCEMMRECGCDWTRV